MLPAADIYLHHLGTGADQTGLDRLKGIGRIRQARRWHPGLHDDVTREPHVVSQVMVQDGGQTFVVEQLVVSVEP